MKNICILLLIYSFNTSCYANLGIIQDKDGYANIRSTPSLHAKIINKMNNDALVHCLDHESKDFCDIQTEQEYEGYVHLSRVHFLKEDKTWKIEKISDQQVNYTQQKNKISIFTGPLTFKKSDFSYSKDPIPILKYKGNRFWGTDNGIPESKMIQIEHINGVVDGFVFSIPAEILQGYVFPMEPLGKNGKLDHEMMKVYRDGKDIYLSFKLNIGGAAQYGLVFKINQGKFIRKWTWSMSI